MSSVLLDCLWQEVVESVVWTDDNVPVICALRECCLMFLNTITRRNTLSTPCLSTFYLHEVQYQMYMKDDLENFKWLLHYFQLQHTFQVNQIIVCISPDPRWYQAVEHILDARSCFSAAVDFFNPKLIEYIYNKNEDQCQFNHTHYVICQNGVYNKNNLEFIMCNLQHHQPKYISHYYV